MEKFHCRVLAVVAVASATACASSPPPAARAAGVERVQCVGETGGQDEVALLRSTTVLRVEPIYSRVPTANNDTEARANGAKLLIRPPKGVSSEQMTRILQCHSARILLGKENGSLIPNDPYWLPDAWVNIEVRPEDGNFAVTIQADSIRDNLQVLGHANHYADEHMIATEPAALP